MKISNTREASGDALKVLIYGEPGAGKTTLAGTIGEPTLIISAEAGLLCLAGKDIDVVDISQDDDGNLIPKEMRIDRLGEVYQFLLTDEARKKYKWLFLDSLTEINQTLVDKLALEYPERSQNLVLYGENAKRMRSLIKSFRDIPGYSVVMTALAKQDKDDQNQKYIAPSLVGSIADAAPAFFDLVMYLHVDTDKETGETTRQLVTSKTDKLIVKDRSGKLEKYEPADLGLIARKIRSQPAKEKNGKVEKN